MKEMSVKAAAASAQISTQNVQESLIANIRIDEEALQAGIIRLLPSKEKQCDTSSIMVNDQQPQGGVSLMKETPGNGVNEDSDSKVGLKT